ncbi:MAG: FtsW/RodA/SpoVE family cell cycle protein [Actinobacteria bacterium]|nr:FtsW/RodA/SpoVE family cell cycle protein [Actinomycetota bacterium]
MKVFTARKRNIELILLACVLGISRLALYLVENATAFRSPISASQIYVVIAMVLIAHLAIRVFAPFADQFLFPLAVLLNLLGIVMIHRLDIADEVRAAASQSTFSTEASSQLIWFAIGILLLIATLVIVKDHRRLQRYTFTAMVAGLVLLLLPMLPILGASINGARLWIRIGSLSFQPAEVAKIVLPIFFAGYLARNRNSIASVREKWAGIGLPRAKDLGPIVSAWAISLLVLISQRDLGTSLLFFGLFVGMLYVATGQRTWLALGGLLFLSGAFIAYQLFSHVKLRTMVWLDPFPYALNESYQLVQGLYGFASGGLFGRGLGQGYSWLVPYAKSDFILSAFGEELGYVGLIAITFIYAFIVQRTLRTSLMTKDDFGKLLSAGLAIVLGLQLFVVFGGVTRLIPLTGLTTPFLAAGGSALIANWIMIALVLRISHTSTLLSAPSGRQL